MVLGISTHLVLLVVANLIGWWIYVRPGFESAIGGLSGPDSPTAPMEPSHDDLDQLPKELVEDLLTTQKTHNRVNATFVTLCRNEDMYDMMSTIQNYEDRFNRRYHYDWVFLNDKEFTKEFKGNITNMVSGEVKFGTVPKEHWGVPDWIDLDKMHRNMEILSNLKEFDPDWGLSIPYANSSSYRNMCRFQSGFLQWHPLLLDYEYYWRVEPGVVLYCDINYDLFRYMKSENKKYGFTISMFEFKKTIPSLYSTIKQYLSEFNKTSLLNSTDNLSNFIHDEDTQDYTLCHFWSNFEIASLDFFRSELYQSYFNFLDASGGFYYERWGDAPVHSILASLFLNQDELHWFDDIGYYHGPYAQCPTKNYKENKCSCRPESDFSMSLYSCIPFFLSSKGVSPF